MSHDRLSSAEIRQLKSILARAGAVDIHFVKGLITAFACIDNSADAEFIYSVVLGENDALAEDIYQSTNFVELFDRLTTQTLDELYEYRYRLPPKTQFDASNFESNFSLDNPIANWAKGVHTGLSFCCGRAEAEQRDELVDIYQRLLEFSCETIFVFIDADVANAVYKNSNAQLFMSLPEMMVMARKKLPSTIKNLIEMAYILVTDGVDAEGDDLDQSEFLPPEGFEPDSLGAVDQLLQESELESDKKRRIALLEKAVNLGRAQLGADFFKENVGYFWGLIETRPFMRALVNLADAYRQAHMRDKSLLCYRECLLLCPDDNLGARYLLPALLMEMGDFSAALKLIDEHADELPDSAFLAYSRALCLTALKFSAADILKAFKVAYKSNAAVPGLLLSEGELPLPDSPYCSAGDKNEAIFYVTENRMLWRNIAGAMQYIENF